VVGRFPWKTLGVDPVYDGEGEPLWLMTRGFRDPPINFATAAGLTVTTGGVATPVVAIIIAPGRPRNTASLAGTLTGCTKQNQMVDGRNQATLVPANFIECGVTTGSITSPGNADWTNDRVIAITAAEWADAIAPAIADRLQRQVAPAMYDFYNTTSLASWGQRFFPNASTFSTPASNSLCGVVDTFSGMPPTATVASGTCSTNWDSISVSGLGGLLSPGACFLDATGIVCDFSMLLPGVATPQINITAPRVGYAYRYVDTSQITLQVTSPVPLLPSTATVNVLPGTVSSITGRGTFRFQITFPLLAALQEVRVRIPFATDALAADARSAWYVTNSWDRFTYYGISQAASHDAAGTQCTPGGNLTNCLTVSGLPASTPPGDKRLVLVLMGRALPGKTWGANLDDYLDPIDPLAPVPADNSTAGDNQYTASTVTATFNDRIAVCPFKLQNHAGTDVTLCN
jgi:hypothetical protein